MDVLNGSSNGASAAAHMAASAEPDLRSLDPAEISRRARKVIDAKRVLSVMMNQEEGAAAGGGSMTANPHRLAPRPTPQIPLSWDSARSSEVDSFGATTSTAGPSSIPTRKRPKFTRSTRGCMTCRKQKVKCDESLPVCLRCMGAERECIWPNEEQMQGRKGKKRRTSATDPGDGAGGTGSASPPTEATTTTSMHIKGSAQSSRPPSLPRFNNDSDARSEAWASILSAAKAVEQNDLVDVPSSSASLSRPDSRTNNHQTFERHHRVTAFGVGNGHSITLAGSPKFDLASPSYGTPRNAMDLPLALASSSSSSALINGGGFAESQIRSSSHTPTPSRHNVVDNNTDPTLPLENMEKSLLLARRQGKAPVPSSAPGPISSDGHPHIGQHAHMSVEAILYAYENDPALFEFGPSERAHPEDVIAPTIDHLTNAFPSVVARHLFHHYCTSTSRILITMGEIGPNPYLTLCSPTRLLDTNSPSSAALRMSMLSTTLVHFVSDLENSGATEGKSIWPQQKAQLREMGSKFKRAALANIMLTSSSASQEFDNVLAASVILLIRDVIGADSGWRDNLEYAVGLVNKKGGPASVLSADPTNFTRRFLIEELTAHDVFSCLVTGKEPCLLDNFDPWWFQCVETSKTRWEWESYERSFGMSRGMLDLMARIVTLRSRKMRLGAALQNDSREGRSLKGHFAREAEALLVELDVWGSSLPNIPQHYRVTCGDYIYKYTASVVLLADIMEEPLCAPRIMNAVDYILELCSEASAMRLCVMLVWPLLIAGAYCQRSVRDKVESLCDAFQAYYCEDLIAARKLLRAQWRLIDAGKGPQPWSTVMESIGVYVMLL